MDLNELRDRFLVDDDIRQDRLAKLVEKALAHCVVHKNGAVELRHGRLAGKDQVKLVLSARLIASSLEESLPGDVTVDQLSEYTGLPKNQAAARAKECLDERFAERSARGSYRARSLKVEEFLDSLVRAKAPERAS
jgi:hypothetical protein